MRRILLGLVAVALLAALSVDARGRAVGHELPFSATWAWSIRQTQVLNPGTTSQGEQGRLTLGREIQANAEPLFGDGVQPGTFRARLSSFTPSRDLPGQERGKCYVQVAWSIVTKVDAESEKRHGDVIIRGTMQAVLDFDPSETLGDLAAQVDVPASMGETGWLAASGEFVGDSDFNGLLQVEVDKPAQPDRQSGE